MKTIVVLALILSVYTVSPQTLSWQWAKSAASANNEQAWDVAYDRSSGNSYLAGITEGGLQNVYGTLFTSSLGSRDGFLAKYDESGNVLWAFQLGGSGVDEIKSVATDPWGNVYVVGTFQSLVDFDPGLGLATLVSTGVSEDGFLAKYNASGNYLWAIKFGGSAQEECRKVFADSNGVYICGSYIGSAIFNSTDLSTKSAAAAQSQANFFAAKYSHSGVAQWVISGGSEKNDYAADIIADNNRVYLTGSYERALTVYNHLGIPTATLQNISPDRYDAFTLAFTQTGAYVWGTNVCSLDSDEGRAITQDANNIYVTGSYKNASAYFNYPNVQFTRANSGNHDIFAASISKQNGSYQWVSDHTGSGTGSEEGFNIKVDSQGNIIVAGYYMSILNYSAFGGPSYTSAGSNDIFILGLSSAGTYLWSKTLGSAKGDLPYGLATTETGHLILAGLFRGDLPIGGLLLPEDNGDNAFIAKTGCSMLSNNTIPVSQTVCVNAPPLITGSLPSGDPSNAYTYLWLQSTDNINWTAAPGTNSAPDYSPAVLSSEMFFKRIVFSGNVCNDSLPSNSFHLRATPLTPAAVAGPDQTVCGTSAIVTGNTPSNTSGFWTLVSGSAVIHSPFTYSTSVSVSSASVVLRWELTSGSCPSEHDDLVIEKHDPPSIALAGTDVSAETATVQLNATAPEMGTGFWSVVSGSATVLNMGSNTTEVLLHSEGEHIFRWTVCSGSACPSSSDEVAVIWQKVHVADDVNPTPNSVGFEIPNAITPNGDGMNDTFVISGTESSKIELKIFNRWGAKVFEDSNYRHTWSGCNMKNEPLADDTYFYTMQISGRGSYTGFIIIKR